MPSNHSSYNNASFSKQLSTTPSHRLLSHLDSDSDTDTETTSDDSESSVDPIPAVISTTNKPLYHNPRFVGSIPYYFPRRQPDPAAASESYHPIPTSPDNPALLEPNRSHRSHQTTLDSCWTDFQSSCSDLKTNEHWGDNIEINHAHSFRIYFQNLNSCSLSQDSQKWRQIIKSMKKADCDIMNFAQTSLNWRFLPIRDRMRKVIFKAMPISKLNIGRNKFVSEQRTLH